ncbi:Oidioi.mRNA.OKI2018_I69.chr1.g812.t1.cds [Oikopleura dioica]|uniref:Oidioi.mRNA.OKI2018_I69.chr1.g812.t1.cds n=1 Tax=Oikopleura dioica TaxID=34765 RepID=A0ABN7SPN5_OIKDI|nr:Oidioi.mRNA.OKI2018_I69.chr1.g812.t1.cds [Oikopleura dioica]
MNDEISSRFFNGFANVQQYVDNNHYNNCNETYPNIQNYAAQNETLEPIMDNGMTDEMAWNQYAVIITYLVYFSVGLIANLAIILVLMVSPVKTASFGMI